MIKSTPTKLIFIIFSAFAIFFNYPWFGFGRLGRQKFFFRKFKYRTTIYYDINRDNGCRGDLLRDR